MAAAITDPSNPSGTDYPVKQPSIALRLWQAARAKVKHDAAPAIARWAIYWANHKTTTMCTHYDEVRPIPFARHWLSPKLWYARRCVSTDCSGAAEIVAALAGVNTSPSGYPWTSGTGNSGSFYVTAAKRFTDVRDLKVGDYAAYGIDGDEHISIIVAVKPEPMVVSHGRPGGPYLQPLSLDTRPRTFLRVNTRARTVQFPPKG